MREGVMSLFYCLCSNSRQAQNLSRLFNRSRFFVKIPDDFGGVLHKFGIILDELPFFQIDIIFESDPDMTI